MVGIVKAARLISIAIFAVLAAAEAYLLAGYAPQRVSAAPRHPIELREFGAGVPISQSFTPHGDGLSEITFTTDAPAESSGELSWALLEQVDAGWRTVLSTRRRLSLARGRAEQVLRFPAIDRSAERTYRVDLSLACPSRCDAALVASREDALADGFLTLGGVEQWGDLAFSAKTATDTVAGRLATNVVPGLPGPLSSMFVWAVLLVLATLAVSRAGGAALAASAPIAISPRSRSGLPSAVLMLALVAATAATIAAKPRTDTIDLLDELYRARFEPTPAGLHWSVHQGDRAIAGLELPAVYAHARSRIGWTVTVASHMHLRAGMAVDPGAWPFGAGDGVFFRVSALDQGREVPLFGQLVDPAHVAEDQRWVPLDVNLSAFTGRTIELLLTTEPSAPGAPENAAYDWAMWGAPRVEIVR